MNRGAVILCGGKSTRMGRDKATLPFGPETMLQRVVRRLAEVVPVEHLVVVAAADQGLPPLPNGITIARDLQPARGPLEGLAAGLRSLPSAVDAAYVTSCDVPLLSPAFVERMFSLLDEPGPSGVRFDIAVPKDDAYHHPLAAVYRPSVLFTIEKLLAADRLRPRFLFDEMSTREVPVQELRDVDLPLDTLKNLNTPDDYLEALNTTGFGKIS